MTLSTTKNDHRQNKSKKKIYFLKPIRLKSFASDYKSSSTGTKKLTICFFISLKSSLIYYTTIKRHYIRQQTKYTLCNLYFIIQQLLYYILYTHEFTIIMYKVLVLLVTRFAFICHNQRHFFTDMHTNHLSHRKRSGPSPMGKNRWREKKSLLSLRSIDEVCVYRLTSSFLLLTQCYIK